MSCVVGTLPCGARVGLGVRGLRTWMLVRPTGTALGAWTKICCWPPGATVGSPSRTWPGYDLVPTRKSTLMSLKLLPGPAVNRSPVRTRRGPAGEDPPSHVPDPRDEFAEVERAVGLDMALNRRDRRAQAVPGNDREGSAVADPRVRWRGGASKAVAIDNAVFHLDPGGVPVSGGV